jgi:hypothetical protein
MLAIGMPEPGVNIAARTVILVCVDCSALRARGLVPPSAATRLLADRAGSCL